MAQPLASPAAPPSVQDRERLASLARLVELAGGLGYEIIDIAGFLSDVDRQAIEQLDILQNVQVVAQRMRSANEEISTSADRVAQSSRDTLDVTKRSAADVEASSAHTRDVAQWVQSVHNRVGELTTVVSAISSDIEDIANISKMVNILALNASIEAYRAGEAGKGFAVVAKEVNDLSQKTEHAARSITGNIAELTDWTSQLRKEANDASSHAENVLSGTQRTNEALARISSGVEEVAREAATIQSQASDIQSAATRFAPAVETVLKGSQTTAAGVEEANARINSLIDRSEAIVQETAGLHEGGPDARFIGKVQTVASQVSQIFELALQKREISLQDLFDEHYTPVPGTNPEQHMTRFVGFTDKHLRTLQEEALDFSEAVSFCAAVDRNGFLPTHNLKFSQPQSADPAWNAGNCRNRRIFNDRVGLKAGRNQKPFLLQVYRRDMGAGQFVIMKDVSAPIFVQGRHWGGIRMGYTF